MIYTLEMKLDLLREVAENGGSLTLRTRPAEGVQAYTTNPLTGSPAELHALARVLTTIHKCLASEGELPEEGVEEFHLTAVGHRALEEGTIAPPEGGFTVVASGARSLAQQFADAEAENLIAAKGKRVRHPVGQYDEGGELAGEGA